MEIQRGMRGYHKSRTFHKTNFDFWASALEFEDLWFFDFSTFRILLPLFDFSDFSTFAATFRLFGLFDFSSFAATFRLFDFSTFRVFFHSSHLRPWMHPGSPTVYLQVGNDHISHLRKRNIISSKSAGWRGRWASFEEGSSHKNLINPIPRDGILKRCKRLAASLIWVVVWHVFLLSTPIPWANDPSWQFFRMGRSTSN